jgi:hypothetical protein
MRFRILPDPYLGLTRTHPLRSTQATIEIGFQPPQDVTGGSSPTAAVGLPPGALKVIVNVVQEMAPDHVDNAGAWQPGRSS